MEFEVNGQQYRVEKVDAFEQLQVARRLMPLQVAMGVSLAKIGDGLNDEATIFQFLGAPVAECVSKMSQEDFDYVMKAAAKACRRQQGERWAPVMTGGNLMFKDINMQVLLRMIVEFVKENLGDFFAGLGGPNG